MVAGPHVPGKTPRLAKSLGFGQDQRYGARHLKRAIERRVVSPLARLLATTQVRPGDVLIIGRHPGEKYLVFLRDTNHQTLGAQMPFVVSFSRFLTAAEVTA